MPPCFRCVCGFVSDTPHDPPTHLRAAACLAATWTADAGGAGVPRCTAGWGELAVKASGGVGGPRSPKSIGDMWGKTGLGCRPPMHCSVDSAWCCTCYLFLLPVGCGVVGGGGRGEVADVADGSVVQWSRPYGWVLACGVASGFCVVLPGNNQSHVRREGVPGAHGVLGVAGWFCSACEAQRTHMRAERPCIQVQCMECAVYGRRDYPRPRWMKIYIGCMRGGCPSYTQLQCVSHMGPPGWRSGCVMVALLYGNQAT